MPHPFFDFLFDVASNNAPYPILCFFTDIGLTPHTTHTHYRQQFLYCFLRISTIVLFKWFHF